MGVFKMYLGKMFNKDTNINIKTIKVVNQIEEVTTEMKRVWRNTQEENFINIDLQFATVRGVGGGKA